MSELDIQPPSNPLARAINGAVLDYYWQNFKDKYLPGYEVRVTSRYRNQKDNARVGGVPNSAHLHNLAIDFVIDTNGKPNYALTEKVWHDIVSRKWRGFSLYHKNHIHVNLTRKISRLSSAIAVAMMAILGLTFFGIIKE